MTRMMPSKARPSVYYVIPAKSTISCQSWLRDGNHFRNLGSIIKKRTALISRILSTYICNQSSNWFHVCSSHHRYSHISPSHKHGPPGQAQIPQPQIYPSHLPILSPAPTSAPPRPRRRIPLPASARCQPGLVVRTRKMDNQQTFRRGRGARTVGFGRGEGQECKGEFGAALGQLDWG